MAKKEKGEGISEERRANVLLEEMRTDIKRIAEGHGGLERHLEEHDKEFKTIKRDMKIIEAAVSENGRGIKELNITVNQHTEDIKEIKGTLNQHTEDIKDIKGTVNQINEKLDKVLVDHEERIRKVEVIR